MAIRDLSPLLISGMLLINNLNAFFRTAGMIIAAKFVAVNMVAANRAMIVRKFIITSFFSVAHHLNKTPVNHYQLLWFVFVKDQNKNC